MIGQTLGHYRIVREIGAGGMGVADVTAELQPLSEGREIDVAALNHADPLFLNQVMEPARPLYGSERRFHELRLKAFELGPGFLPQRAGTRGWHNGGSWNARAAAR